MRSITNYFNDIVNDLVIIFRSPNGEMFCPYKQKFSLHNGY